MPLNFASTRNLVRKNTLNFLSPSLRLILLLLFFLCHTTVHAEDATTADTTDEVPEKHKKKADGTNNPLLISTANPKLKAEKEFNKIQSYESYDPITDTWSTIENFEDVEILDNVTEKPNDSYIYRSFWAYDPLTHEWYRVDISEYGYKKIRASGLEEEDEEGDEEDKKQKEWGFWKNLGISLSGGWGVTYHNYQIKNMNMLIRTTQQEFFLQPRNSKVSIYQLQWLNTRPMKINTLEHANMRNLYITLSQDHSFTNIGVLNIPITLTLHYTFFDRLRIGLGSNIELSQLKTLSTKHGDIGEIEYEVPQNWFLNLKHFGIIGYKVYRGEKHSLFIESRIGMALDYGNKDWAFKSLLKTLSNYEYTSFYFSLGPYHEIRLNSFFKFFYGLCFQYKCFDKDDDFSADKNSSDKPSMLLWQPSLHLEVGITLHFGRDKKQDADEEGETEDEDEDEGGGETDPAGKNGTGNGLQDVVGGPGIGNVPEDTDEQDKKTEPGDGLQALFADEDVDNALQDEDEQAKPLDLNTSPFDKDPSDEATMVRETEEP